MRETDLYAPIKTFLEGQGYEVKAEITDCDLVAVRGGEAPVIIELKLSLSLALLLQGVDRQAITDWVYVAVPVGKGARWRGQVRDAVKLCRRLGLGLISVSTRGLVQVHADPGPYRPRKAPRRKTALLREFSRRVGDPNKGGQVGRPIVTAYRQDALRIATALQVRGPSRPAELAKICGVPKAGVILLKDHYGWFANVSRGVYQLAPDGVSALDLYRDVVASL
ncbi:MAG: hypothetical protein GXP03_15170 [Alphaproteobacteria bacterium]|nr:hypothetical protein [Alphaproteobacteria bacterium]